MNAARPRLRPRYVLVAPDGRYGPSCHRESSLRAAAHYPDNRLYEIDVEQMRELGKQPKAELWAWCEANAKRLV